VLSVARGNHVPVVARWMSAAERAVRNWVRPARSLDARLGTAGVATQVLAADGIQVGVSFRGSLPEPW
jgi:hypothetical protein